jgi:hypothetical protein
MLCSTSPNSVFPLVNDCAANAAALNILNEGKMQLADTQSDIQAVHTDVFSSPVKSPVTVVHRAAVNSNIIHPAVVHHKVTPPAVAQPNVARPTATHSAVTHHRPVVHTPSTTPQSPPPVSSAWASPTSRKLYVVLKGREVGVFDSW